MNRSFKISVGFSNKGVLKTKVVPWDKIVEVLSKHQVIEDKNKGPAFIAGYSKNNGRKESDIVERTLITLDIDNIDMSLSDLELDLRMKLDCAFVAYSTYRHTKDKPRVRVVVPLSQGVTPKTYRTLVNNFVASVGLPVDSCSDVPNQLMYLPACAEGADTWTLTQDGEPLEVSAYLEAGELTKVVEETDDALTDLVSAVRHKPLEIGVDEVDAYLDAYPSLTLEYDDWLTVGAALHHQFAGSDEGYSKWHDWSAQSPKHDPKQMKLKWRSFGKTSNPITFASIIFKVQEAGGITGLTHVSDIDVGDTTQSVESKPMSRLDTLLLEASELDNVEAYAKFKAKIAKMPANLLPSDYRAMIASEVVGGFGKLAGLNKSDVKKALEPKQRKGELDVSVELEEVERPDWASHWVYIEKTMEFASTRLHYAIKREAFNAKFNREPECLIAEKQASDLVLNDYRIPTVVDNIYWPSAEAILTYQDKLMLNTYVRDGIQPCDEVDEDGQKVIDMFLNHVKFTIADEAEQGILLDFLAYIVQNQGSRINWALLLQGAQGTGKSYFVNVMQAVLGTGVRNVDPSALSGRFTGWAYGSILNAIEEIRVAGSNKYEVFDRMKPFVTNTTIQIEEKGRDHRVVPNFASYLLLTNHKDALPVNQGDRRYCIIYGRVQSEEQLYTDLGGRSGAEDYFDNLFAESTRRADALAYYLYHRQISATFNAKGRAPETTARLRMMNYNISEGRDTVEDAIEKFHCDVINDRIIDVTFLQQECLMEGVELPKTRALSAILLEMGYSSIESRRVRIRNPREKHSIWFRGSESGVIEIVKKHFEK